MLSDVIYRPMWRKRWRHTRSCQNNYIYVICYQCDRASDSFWSGVYSWTIKRTQNDRFLPNGCENTILGAVQRTSTIPAWCQQRLGTFSKGNHSSFCIWCRYLVALYTKCGYILDVLRPQQLPEDVIETVNTQNWYNHIIGFDTSFHSMV